MQKVKEYFNFTLLPSFMTRTDFEIVGDRGSFLHLYDIALDIVPRMA